MSDDMVERVAKAIYESATPRPDKWRWKELDRLQEPYRRIARDVIAAMREPTEAMIDAALHDYATHGPRQSPFGQDGSFAATWQAMIDEVLK